jgi:hypothetical protein
MFAAFVFNGTVHEWGHEYSNMGGYSPKVRGQNSWMVDFHWVNFTCHFFSLCYITCCTLTSPYLGEYFSGSRGILIEAMLSFCIAMAVTVVAKIDLIVKANLEVNMKTIARVICVGGGTALLGRSFDDIVSYLQKICVNH